MRIMLSSNHCGASIMKTFWEKYGSTLKTAGVLVLAAVAGAVAQTAVTKYRNKSM